MFTVQLKREETTLHGGKLEKVLIVMCCLIICKSSQESICISSNKKCFLKTWSSSDWNWPYRLLTKGVCNKIWLNFKLQGLCGLKNTTLIISPGTSEQVICISRIWCKRRSDLKVRLVSISLSLEIGMKFTSYCDCLNEVFPVSLILDPQLVVICSWGGLRRMTLMEGWPWWLWGFKRYLPFRVLSPCLVQH